MNLLRYIATMVCPFFLWSCTAFDGLEKAGARDRRHGPSDARVSPSDPPSDSPCFDEGGGTIWVNENGTCVQKIHYCGKILPTDEDRQCAEKMNPVFPQNSCSNRKPTIATGIYGCVGETRGNCMPSPGSDNSCPPFAISNKIYLTSVAFESDLKRKFLNNDAKILKELKPESDGFFQVEMPNGLYSIFIEESGNKRCDRGSDEGLCAVRVKDKPVRYDPVLENAAY